MNNKLVIAILVFVIVVSLFHYLAEYQKKKLKDLLKKREFDKYEKTLNNFFIKILINPATCENLKLKGYKESGNYQKIDAYFDRLTNANVNKRQKIVNYINALYFYSDPINYNLERCQNYYEAINKVADENIKKQIALYFDIKVIGNTTHLEELHELLKQNPDNSFYEYLLFITYSNLEDKKNADKYKNRYKKTSR